MYNFFKFDEMVLIYLMYPIFPKKSLNILFITSVYFSVFDKIYFLKNLLFYFLFLLLYNIFIKLKYSRINIFFMSLGLFLFVTQKIEKVGFDYYSVINVINVLIISFILYNIIDKFRELIISR